MPGGSPFLPSTNSHTLRAQLQATRIAPSPRVPGICQVVPSASLQGQPRGWLPVGPPQPEASGSGADETGHFKMASRYPFRIQVASSLFSNPRPCFKLPEIFSETSAWGRRVGHDLAIEQQWLSPHRSLGKAVSAGSRETQPAQSLLYQMHEEPCLLSAKGGQGRRSPKRAGRATCDGRWTPHPACIRPLSRL